ncbi:hypothetical protein CISIN_1g0112711mg, partial [Citrus sinensis]
LQYKEAEGSSYRDGSYIDMPGTPKVGLLIFDFFFFNNVLFLLFRLL